MAKKTLRIPLIIDATGAWCAYGYTALEGTGEADWGMIDETANPDEALTCPKRYWVTVEVDLPETGEVQAVAEPIE